MAADVSNASKQSINYEMFNDLMFNDLNKSVELIVINKPSNLERDESNLVEEESAASIIDKKYAEVKFYKNLYSDLREELKAFVRTEVTNLKSISSTEMNYKNNSLVDEVRSLREEVKSKNQIIEILLSERSMRRDKESFLQDINTYNLYGNETLPSSLRITDDCNIAANISTPSASILVDCTNRYKQQMQPTDMEVCIDKVEAQLLKVRKEHNEKYKASLVTKQSSNVVNQTKPESKNTNEISSPQPKVLYKENTIVIAGDSMLNGLEENRMSSKNLVKVRTFPGATVDDMKDFLRPDTKEKPKKTNSACGNKRCSKQKFKSHFERNTILKRICRKRNPQLRGNNFKSYPTHR